MIEEKVIGIGDMVEMYHNRRDKLEQVYQGKDGAVFVNGSNIEAWSFKGVDEMGPKILVIPKNLIREEDKIFMLNNKPSKEAKIEYDVLLDRLINYTCTQ